MVCLYLIPYALGESSHPTSHLVRQALAWQVYSTLHPALHRFGGLELRYSHLCDWYLSTMLCPRTPVRHIFKSHGLLQGIRLVLFPSPCLIFSLVPRESACPVFSLLVPEWEGTHEIRRFELRFWCSQTLASCFSAVVLSSWRLWPCHCNIHGPPCVLAPVGKPTPAPWQHHFFLLPPPHPHTFKDLSFESC